MSEESPGTGDREKAADTAAGGAPARGIDSRAALAAAVRHHRAGRLREARAIYERVLHFQPDNPEALSLMGLLLHQTGRDEAAVEVLHRALARRPDFAEAHVNLGHALRAQGRLEEAARHFERAVTLKPGFAGAYNNLGLLLQELGKLDQAVIWFEKALLVDSRFSDAHNNLGLALQTLGRLDEAMKRYRRALTIEPRFAEARNNLGTAYRDRGDLEQALVCYRRALQNRPDHVQARINLGIVLQEQGKLDEAIKEYRAALESHPHLPELHNHLGAALQAQGDIEAAVRHYEKAIELKPAYAEAYINLGNLHREMGRYDDAVTRLLEALALEPRSAPAYVDLGVALQEQGQPAQAIEQYEKALALKPGYAHAHRNQGIALLELGRYKEAKGAFHNVLRANHGGLWWNAGRFVDVGGAPPRHAQNELRASTFKLQDLIDQIEYLVAKGLLHHSFNEMAERYRGVLREIGDAVGDDDTTTLTRAQVERVGGFYNKVIRFHDAPRLAGGAVNPDLDFAAIEENYFSSPVSVTVFDDLLTPAALAALRDFCLESTIFFGYSGARFVGSDLGNGFNCSLLYQIAEELKAGFPRLLGAHQLSNMWVYRHRNQSIGVEAHTDQGQVTFNFWISPAAANRDPERGGLIVYAKEQPYDWDWLLFNRYKNRPDILRRIVEFLDTAETITIPYGENRALLFHSNLFHKSDHIDFEDGYANRRINVTMLFGKRAAGNS
ncbi:MAG: tetratricopeptide repeat protein [Alphaproteobacteria bacterium]